MSLVLRNKLVVALTAALLIVSGYCLHVFAEGAPSAQPLWYAGSVTDDAGAPLTGSHQVSVRLYDQATASSALCVTGPAPLPFERGRFRIELAAECEAAIHKNPDLFVEVAIDDESKPFPRSKIGAVPYALEAAHAARASEAAGALKQTIDSLPKITEWTAFKPEVFASNTPIGLTDNQASGRYRRVGDSIEAQYILRVAAVGTNTGLVSFSLPNGLKPDLTKLVDFAEVGSGNLYAPMAVGGPATWIVGTEISHATSRIQVVFNAQGGANAVLSHDAPFMLNTGGVTHFNVSVPVEGWTLSAP